MRASEILLTVYDPTRKQFVCNTTANIKAGLMKSKHVIDFTSCPEMKGSKYLVTVTDPGHKSKGLLYNSTQINQGDFMPLDYITIKRGSRGSWEVADWSKTIYVLYALNPKISNTDDNVSCDEDASPLVIDTSDFVVNGQGLPLSSPAEGVQFDILGERSFPAAHAKKQISWFKDARFMWLVLPDKNGNVNGINEMFGNNTRGPDGQYAANGYKALAKYDWNRDGKISAWDPVFSKLRLWSDINADGVAQPNELFTLDRIGITDIKLRYERKFTEEDQYGNTTRYRSTVTMKDGSTHRTYDIWFEIQ